jgi:PadR family transcriptional regulator, regulatory protein AphA
MSLRHAILGLLSLQPMSGYDLKKVIDESVGHFWAADQSQIYRTLAALVEEGLASRRTVVQADRPNLHLHSATDDGLAELDRWLTSPLQAPAAREPFLARLFFADRLPAAQLQEVLSRHREELGEQLAALEAINVPDVRPEGVSASGYVLRLATLANGIAHARTELEWLEATERELERITT